MEEIECKQLLTKSKDSSLWFGNDYNMNLYKGCCHGCIYCDSRSDCYHIEDFDSVRVKKDCVTILEKELRSKKQKGVVSIGAMSDPYNPFEKELEVTRKSLALLDRYGYGVSLDTKSDLVVRDIDILERISKHSDVCIKITITTPHDSISSIIEPNVCVSSKRFEAVAKLSEKGIYVGILMNPLLPFISDSEEDIKQMVQKASVAGAKFIHTFMGVTLRTNQRDYFYQQLNKHYSGLSNQYATSYGSRYDCRIPKWKHKYEVFKQECERYGILYRMEDIIRDYQKHSKKTEQLTLF